MKFKLFIAIALFLAVLPVLSRACTTHDQCSQACNNLGYGTCPYGVYSCMIRDCCIGQCNYQTTNQCSCAHTTYVDTKGSVCPTGATCGSDCRCHPAQVQPPESQHVCNPGEIKNRNCACLTQVGYERCRDDGSVWEDRIETCPSGQTCQNGQCVSPIQPSFDCNSLDNWYGISDERCDIGSDQCGSGTQEKKQEYRDYYPTVVPPCSTSQCSYTVTNSRWISADSCYTSCSSGYTCQSGVCISNQPCTEGYTGNYRCYDDWIQKEYQNSNCDTTWVFYNYCSDGCSGTSCVHPSWCKADYLDEYRCSGDWRQREYQYSDCRTEWLNWEHCSGYCHDDSCRYEEPCNVNVDVTTPDDARVGETLTATVTVRNTGDRGCYVNLDAYVCKVDPYCYHMTCNGEYGDPRVYVYGHETYTLSCTAKLNDKDTYEVKVVYSGCDGSGTVYSERFRVEEPAKPKCTAQFFEDYRCVEKWRQQLYKYSNCDTTWVTLEVCSYGCSDGKCLPSPTTTTIPPKLVVLTGWDVFVNTLTSPWLIGLLVLVLLVILFFILANECVCCRAEPRGNAPEWFGGQTSQPSESKGFKVNS